MLKFRKFFILSPLPSNKMDISDQSIIFQAYDDKVKVRIGIQNISKKFEELSLYVVTDKKTVKVTDIDSSSSSFNYEVTISQNDGRLKDLNIAPAGFFVSCMGNIISSSEGIDINKIKSLQNKKEEENKKQDEPKNNVIVLKDRNIAPTNENCKQEIQKNTVSEGEKKRGRKKGVNKNESYLKKFEDKIPYPKAENIINDEVYRLYKIPKKDLNEENIHNLPVIFLPMLFFKNAIKKEYIFGVHMKKSKIELIYGIPGKKDMAVPPFNKFIQAKDQGYWIITYNIEKKEFEEEKEKAN